MLGNIEGFTRRQAIGACKARELYHGLQRPGMEAFENMIRAGQIRDCPVTLQDVKNANLIFGKDLAALKGKTTQIRPPPVTDSTCAVPDELVRNKKKLPATMDKFTICGMKFMAFIDLEVRNVCAEYVKHNTDKVHHEVMDKIFEYYYTHGFRIGKILCDGEFRSMLDPLKNKLGLKLDNPPAQAHANPAERLIRTLEEGCRSTWHATPFLVFTKEMIKELVKAVV